MTRRFLPSLGAAAIGLALLAAPASADTLNMTGGYFYNGGSGYSQVSYTNDPAGLGNSTSATNGNAGGLVGVLSGTNTLFWCEDLYSSLRTGNATYNVSVVSAGTPLYANSATSNGTNWTMTPSATTVPLLNALLSNGQNFVAAQSGTNQNYASAALQVAVWALIYNGNTNAVNLANPTNVFSLTGQANALILSDANSYMQCIAAVAQSGICGGSGWLADSTKEVKSYAFSTNGTVNNGQSFLTLTNKASDTSVPEPTSMLLLAGGLAGLGAIRRKLAAKRG